MHTTDTGARVVSVVNACGQRRGRRALPHRHAARDRDDERLGAPGPLGDELGERAVDLEDVGDGDLSGSGGSGRSTAVVARGAPPTAPGRSPRRSVTRSHATRQRGVYGLVDVERPPLASAPDRERGDDGGTRQRARSGHPRRHPHRRPVGRHRRSGGDAHPRRSGRRRGGGRTARRRREPRHQRVPHVDAQQAQRGARPRRSPTTAPRSTGCSPRPTSSCTTTGRRARASSASTTSRWRRASRS